MKISASVYSWGQSVEISTARLSSFGVDYIHVDCNDDPAVFADIDKIRRVSDLPIDLHIITDGPEKYYDAIRKNKIEIVSFQYEAVERLFDCPTDLNCRLGLAIRTGCDLSVFERYQDVCSFVMFMTTVPGQSGGAFNKATFDEIRMFQKRFPSKAVHVDGGVNHEVGFILKSLNVACVVTGSYLAKAETPGNAIIALRAPSEKLRCLVSDFMMQLNEVPIVFERQANLETIISEIDRGRMGFAIIVDDDRRVLGVVSDGDMRRALLKKIDHLSEITADDLLNRDFIAVRRDMTVEGVIETIDGFLRPILFAPVVDDNCRLVGALSFNNLIRGNA